MLLTRSPLYSGRSPFTLDLHVLGTPPAFVLSQDQTLREVSRYGPKPGSDSQGELIRSQSASHRSLARPRTGARTTISPKEDGALADDSLLVDRGVIPDPTTLFSFQRPLRSWARPGRLAPPFGAVNLPLTIKQPPCSPAQTASRTAAIPLA